MPTPVDREELRRLLRDEQPQLVEVLPRDEYEDEHLPGTINIPLKTLDRETTRPLDRARVEFGPAAARVRVAALR